MFIGLDKLIGLRLNNCCFLHTGRCKRTYRNSGGFNGLSSLTTLDMTSMDINNLDPEVFIHTPMLTHLRIDGIKCKLDENTFVHLKHLEVIEIAKSYIESKVVDTLRKSNIQVIIY